MNLFGRLLLLLLLICSVCFGASKTREGKIAGGHEARPHSNPYVVSLQTRFLWMRFRLCAGSILNERWILSAGHCATDSWTEWFEMDAIVGAHNLAKIRSSMIYSISQRIAHPMYSGGIGPYDIAMMKTSRKIRFSDKVQPIRLPFSAPTFEKPDDLLITGWGDLKGTSSSKIPNKLQEVNVTYLPYSECYEAVDLIKDNVELNPLKRLHNICSGPITEGIAGCTGDSGGPLVQYIPVASSQTTTAGTTHEKEETTTVMASTTPGSTASPTLITSDRPTTTTIGSTTTAESTISPIPMTTDRPPLTIESTTTAGSTVSPIPVTTDRPSATAGSTTTAGSTVSTIPITTERYLITAASTISTSTTAETTTAAVKTKESASTSASHKTLRGLRVDMMPTVIGVLSWGSIPCGDWGAPTVYSNVTNYMDFINKYLLIR